MSSNNPFSAEAEQIREYFAVEKLAAERGLKLELADGPCYAVVSDEANCTHHFIRLGEVRAFVAGHAVGGNHARS